MDEIKKNHYKKLREQGYTWEQIINGELECMGENPDDYSLEDEIGGYHAKKKEDS